MGQMTADEVLAAAANPDAETQRDQFCEAHFYTGEDALLHHRRADATELFKAARDGCPKDYVEYGGALTELKHLAAPAGPATAHPAARPHPATHP